MGGDTAPRCPDLAYTAGRIRRQGRRLLFNSLEFVFFYAVVFALYALLRANWPLRKCLLLLASYCFYMAWNPPYVVLLIFSTALDFVAGRRIAGSDSQSERRIWLAASCVGNLGVLAFFKYSDFLLSNFWIAAAPPFAYPDFVSGLLLPLGISFYTFQSLSYTIDVYRDRRAVSGSALDFALYVSFFPQLVAGPIIRSREFLPQLTENRRASPDELLSGFDQIARGFAKKILCADVLAAYVDLVYADPGSFGAVNHWLAIYAYAFQIYFDFSGYSDIAIGVARTLGFRIPPNFRLPYLACGPSDFWNRWHISLSTWLRDYLYISLGGSRTTRWRTYLNLAITMLLGGLWHGAAWGFVCWGAFHGAWLVIHRALFRERRGFRVPGWMSVLLTFHGVCVGWVLFRAQSLSDALTVYAAFFDFETPVTTVQPLVLAVLAVGFASHLLGASTRLAEAWRAKSVDIQAAVWLATATGVFLLASETTQFIYFQF
ncbi:MAG: MBOAT family protein [Deltaproteobacteria bacterium]|nr:MBOAT family protein [Deltaproteobacteria bacterium]